MSTEDLPCYCSALRRAARSVTRMYDELMSPTGMKITQFALLRNIARAGTISVTELAEKVDLERTSMSRNLAVLERQNWIRLNSAREDQRVREVSLTGAGHKAMEAALPTWRAAQQEMQSRLRAGDIPALKFLLAAAQP